MTHKERIAGARVKHPRATVRRPRPHTRHRLGLKH